MALLVILLPCSIEALAIGYLQVSCVEELTGVASSFMTFEGGPALLPGDRYNWI
jgi:hypothetical protein